VLYNQAQMCVHVNQLSNNIYPHQEHRKREAASHNKTSIILHISFYGPMIIGLE